MSFRKIPVNIEEVKRLKKELKNAKNSIETKRITILISYLWWLNIRQVVKALQVSSSTTEIVINKYIEDPHKFYLTNLKWKQMTKEKEDLKNEVSTLIVEANKKEENVDILDIQRTINKKYWVEKLNYHQARSLVRKCLKSNYQKPYVTNHKQPENAKEIFEERLTEWILHIWSQTKTFDEENIKNKKTKFGRIIA